MWTVFILRVFSSLFAQTPKTEGEGEAAATPAATEEPKPEGEPFIL